MRVKLSLLLTLLALVCLASPMFAQGDMKPADGTPAQNFHWVAVTSRYHAPCARFEASRETWAIERR